MQHENIIYQVEKIPNGYQSSVVDEQNHYYHSNYSNNQMLSPYQQVPSPSGNGQNSPLGGQMSPFNQEGLSPGNPVSPAFDQNIGVSESDNALAQIQQFDAVQKQVINSKNQVLNSVSVSFFVLSFQEVINIFGYFHFYL